MPMVHVEDVAEVSPLFLDDCDDVWDPSSPSDPSLRSDLHPNDVERCSSAAPSASGGSFCEPPAGPAEYFTSGPAEYNPSGPAEYSTSGPAEYNPSGAAEFYSSGSAETPQGFEEIGSPNVSFTFSSDDGVYREALAGNSRNKPPVAASPAFVYDAAQEEDLASDGVEVPCHDTLISCFFCQGPGPSTYSPFTLSEKDLVQSCRSHGVDIRGLATFEKKQLALLHHILSGQCAVHVDEGSPHHGCEACASGLRTQFSMVCFNLDLLLKSTNRQVPVRRLLLVASALGISVRTNPKYARRQLISALKKYADSYRSRERVLDNIPDVYVQYPLDVSSTFANFERLPRAVLLNIAIGHGVHCAKYTGTAESIRDAITEHFAGKCCIANAGLPDSDRVTPACSRIIRSFPPVAPGLDVGQDESSLTLLNELSRLSEKPLRRVMDLLCVSYGPNDREKALRGKFKKYIQRFKRDSLNNDEIEGASSQRLRLVRSAWPELVSQTDKDELVREFSACTSVDALATVACMSCSSAVVKLQSHQIPLHSLDVSPLRRPDKRPVEEGSNVVVDSRWFDGGCLHPDTSSSYISDSSVVIDSKGVCEEGGVLTALLCEECMRHLSKKRTPPLSLANHMFLGDVPPELKDLTVVEEAMISRCRAKSWIIQMKETDPDYSSPITQRGFKGNIVIYPQHPSRVAETLPPSIDELCRPICVIFIGKEPPTREWLDTKAKPLCVRPEKVRAALQWLKNHNKFYKDLHIDHALLDSLPPNYRLPVHVEHVPSGTGVDVLTSRYDYYSSPASNLPSASSDINFESVVVTDVEGNASSNELRAAALRHIQKKKLGFVQIAHDHTPVNEFYNPALFPMIYPTLFPYGVGGFEDVRRSVKVSMQRHVKHLFSLTDRRFQEHYSFLFTAFNMFQRREVLRNTAAKVRRSDFASFASDLSSVDPDVVSYMSDRYARGESMTGLTDEEKKALKLMKQVNVVTNNVMGSSSARVRMRNEIRALQIDQGLPSFFVTINPADVYNPLVRFLAGQEIDLEDVGIDPADQYWEQAKLVAKNPVVAAKFFNIYMNAVINCLLHYANPDKGGILGTVKAYYGCVEAQGRGTLHCHMLIWLEGGLNPNEIKDRILRDGDEEFRKRLLAFLDDTVSTFVPDDPDPSCVVPSSSAHPCSVQGVVAQSYSSVDEYNVARIKDLHNLISKCQTHKHTDTCWKYCKPGQPLECRFHLDEDNTHPESFVDPITGEITMQCVNGLVNNYNQTMIEALRCNMDIKFIGSGASAKAVMYYVTDYITKTQLKTHVAYAALESAIRRAQEQSSGTLVPQPVVAYDDDKGFHPLPPRIDDVAGVVLQAKRLLQKCSFSIMSHQELSAQQVASYLMGFGDHFTSHFFKAFSWSPFEQYVISSCPDPAKEPLSSDSDASLDEPCMQPRPPSPSDDFPEDNEHDPVDRGDVAEGDEDVTDCVVTDDQDSSDVVDCEGEVQIVVGDDGTLAFRTGLLADYYFRSPQLDDLSLWDCVSRVKKVKKTAPRRSRAERTTTDETDDDIAEDSEDLVNEAQESEEENCTLLDTNATYDDSVDEDGHEPAIEDFVDEEESVDEIPEDNPSVSDLLANHGRLRPKFSFQDGHPEQQTHLLQVVHPRDRLVPVPIGPCIPRRDRPEVYDSYCRAMLTFFKPWRNGSDLRCDGQSWSDAFADFASTCSPEVRVRMDNMQLQHECKDSRDDHFSSRASRIRNRRALLRGMVYHERVSEDDDFMGDDPAEVVQHIQSVLASRSEREDASDINAADCIAAAVAGGLYLSSNRRVDTVGTGSHLLVTEEVPVFEASITKAYAQRKKDLRSAVMSVSSQASVANTDTAATDTEAVTGISTIEDARKATIHIDPFLETGVSANVPPDDIECDIDIDEFLSRYDPPLNKEQERSFRIIACHSTSHRQAQLRFFLGGAGGTGKSHVISALKSFFEERNQARRFRLASYTGVAAKNINGVTLHSTLMLDQRSSQKANSKSTRDLISMWEGVDYLFIDEVSMIGCQLMTKISRALGRAKQNSLPFGGVNVIFAGDFAQLPPVRDTRLYAHVDTTRVGTTYGQNSVFGKLLWLAVDTVVILTTVMRQSGDGNARFVQLLDNLRTGSCTDDDFALLQSRIVSSSDEPQALADVPVIVTSNKVKDRMNVKAVEAFAERVGRPLHWYNCTDKHAAVPIADEAVAGLIQGLHSGQTSARLSRIPLVIGMPVVVGQNFDVSGGVVNGATGVLTQVRYKMDADGNRRALSCSVKLDHCTGPPLPSMQAGEVVILRDSVQCAITHPYSKKRYTFTREQLPIMPGFVMTAHKAQGQTMNAAVVDLQTCHGTEEPYVMISRVRSLDGLHILRPFDKKKIQCRQSEDARKEGIRLKHLMYSTLVEHGTAEESAEATRKLQSGDWRTYNTAYAPVVQDNDPVLAQTSEDVSRPAYHLARLQTATDRLSNSSVTLSVSLKRKRDPSVAGTSKRRRNRRTVGNEKQSSTPPSTSAGRGTFTLRPMSSAFTHVEVDHNSTFPVIDEGLGQNQDGCSRSATSTQTCRTSTTSRFALRPLPDSFQSSPKPQSLPVVSTFVRRPLSSLFAPV